MYASYEEMEDAVSEEYQQKITELEDQAVELHREIDALKHEVDVAEEKARQWEIEYRQVERFRLWMSINHHKILTTYEVTQRLEGK